MRHGCLAARAAVAPALRIGTESLAVQRAQTMAEDVAQWRCAPGGHDMYCTANAAPRSRVLNDPIHVDPKCGCERL